MTDQTLELLLKVGLLATIAAFYPQWMRLWHRFGYRQESEVDTTSWKRGLVILGGIFGALIALVVVGTLIK